MMMAVQLKEATAAVTDSSHGQEDHQKPSEKADN